MSAALWKRTASGDLSALCTHHVTLTCSPFNRDSGCLRDLIMGHVTDPKASKEVAMSSLDWCTRSRQLSLLNALLNAHFSNCPISDLEPECSHVLRNAVTTGCKDTLTSLLRHVDESFLQQRHETEDVRGGQTRLQKLLGVAVECGHRDVSDVLLKKGADANSTYRGKPLLHLSLSLGHLRVAWLLVEKGADVNLTDSKGETPLFPGLSSDSKEMDDVIDKLIAKGADVNHRSLTGRQPIHCAALAVNARSLTRLAQAGCDVSARDNVMGDTPLHLACSRCNQEAVVTLIQHGADFNSVNYQGHTPLRKLLQHTTRVSKDFHQHSRMKLARVLLALGFRLVPSCSGKCSGSPSSNPNPDKTSLHTNSSKKICNSSKKQAQVTRLLPDFTGDTSLSLDSKSQNPDKSLNLSLNSESENMDGSSRKDECICTRHSSSLRSRGRDKIGETYHSLVRERKGMPSLQHLCRLEVRKFLPKVRCQESVKKLEVSSYLHQYLMFLPQVMDDTLGCRGFGGGAREGQ